MKRIARLKRPSGLRCATPRRSIASQPIQCAVARAPLSTASSSTRRTTLAAPNSSLRYYSSQKPTPLPASLVDDTHATGPGQTIAPDVEEPPVTSQSELLDDDAAWDTLPAETQLAYRPPPRLRRAQRPDQISDPEYVPATRSDELEAVGGLENWWNRRENWPKTSDFEGFKTHRKIHDQHVLELVVRRAVIEANVLSMLGREHELAAAWPVQKESDAVERCLALDIDVANGRVVIVGDVTAVAKDLTSTAAGAEKVLDTEQVEAQSVVLPSAGQAAEYVEKWSPRWKDASLTDLRMKFAIRKRIFQLTGQLIPDHQLPDIKSIKTLLAILQKPEKPKTLSLEILKTKQDLVELPNVSFVPKRVTRGDKAKALGQFKLIEAEFAKRDIQDVHAVSSKEKSWFKGEA